MGGVHRHRDSSGRIVARFLGLTSERAKAKSFASRKTASGLLAHHDGRGETLGPIVICQTDGVPPMWRPNHAQQQ